MVSLCAIGGCDTARCTLFYIGCISVLTLMARDGCKWVYISASLSPVVPPAHAVMVHPLTTSPVFFTVMV